jgi:biopolymer transport protein ExbD
MRNLFILLIFFSACKLPDPPNMPKRFSPPLKDTARKNIVVKIDKNNMLSIGQKNVPITDLDSTLIHQIDSLHPYEHEVMVVILADSASSFGNVFQIMQAAKKRMAKVVVDVKRE